MAQSIFAAGSFAGYNHASTGIAQAKFLYRGLVIEGT
jgi:hypothetical protein